MKEKGEGNGRRGNGRLSEKRRGSGREIRTGQRGRTLGHERACLALSFVSTALSPGSFQVTAGHPSAAISPLTGPHICFSHSSRTLRSLKVQLN